MVGMTGRNPNGYPYGVNPGAGMQPMAGYQNPAYGWPGVQPPIQAPIQQQGQAAQMSKPTVHADIIQIENEAAGENEPVDAGTSQMMITKDESAILIKSVLANGETIMDVYRKQPKAPKKAEPEYVTREEFERWVAEINRREPEPARKPLRILEPEPAEDDGQEYDAPRPAARKRNTTEGAKRG